jgi:hypothetical protein
MALLVVGLEGQALIERKEREVGRKRLRDRRKGRREEREREREREREE